VRGRFDRLTYGVVTEWRLGWRARFRSSDLGLRRAAVNNFQEGNYGLAAVNAAAAVSDFFLVGAVAKTVARVGVTGLAKFAGSHTDATRKWYRTNFNMPSRAGHISTIGSSSGAQA
jgi:hypothetical protein